MQDKIDWSNTSKCLGNRFLGYPSFAGTILQLNCMRSMRKGTPNMCIEWTATNPCLRIWALCTSYKSTTACTRFPYICNWRRTCWPNMNWWISYSRWKIKECLIRAARLFIISRSIQTKFTEPLSRVLSPKNKINIKAWRIWVHWICKLRERFRLRIGRSRMIWVWELWSQNKIVVFNKKTRWDF